MRCRRWACEFRRRRRTKRRRGRLKKRRRRKISVTMRWFFGSPMPRISNTHTHIKPIMFAHGSYVSVKDQIVKQWLSGMDHLWYISTFNCWCSRYPKIGIQSDSKCSRSGLEIISCVQCTWTKFAIRMSFVFVASIECQLNKSSLASCRRSHFFFIIFTSSIRWVRTFRREFTSNLISFVLPHTIFMILNEQTSDLRSLYVWR